MAIKTFTTGEVLTASDTNTFLANAGLVYVTTATLSGGTFNVDSCFTSTYKNYVLVANITGSAASFCALRMRSGGVTDAGANYNRRGFYNVGAGPVNYSGINETSMFFCQYGTTHAGFTVCELSNPQSASRTVAFIQNMDSAVYDQYQIVDTVATTTQYDGFSLIANSGTLAGTVVVYGRRIA